MLSLQVQTEKAEKPPAFVGNFDWLNFSMFATTKVGGVFKE